MRLSLRAVSCGLFLWVISCSQATTTDHYVQQALLAQATGFGGCAAIERQTTRVIQFFPDVRFVEGICTLEHGDTAHPLVGIDREGMVFVLSSPSSFAFLVRTNKPTGIDSATAIEYARTSLEMMGELSAQDSVIADPADLPELVLRQAGIDRRQLRSSQIQQELQRGYEISLTTLGPHWLSTYIVLVYPEEGIARAMVRDRWQLHRG